MAESDLEATIMEEDIPEDSEQGTSSLVDEEIASGTKHRVAELLRSAKVRCTLYRILDTTKDHITFYSGFTAINNSV